MNLTSLIAPAIISAVVSFAVSLIVPLLNWKVERQRELMKSRRELLAEARTILSEAPDIHEFLNMPIYSRIKPLLSEKTTAAIKEMLGDGTAFMAVITIGAHGGVNQYAHYVLDDMARKESEWGLL